MYYVDINQIEERLGFLPSLIEASRTLSSGWEPSDPIKAFAQERLLHLAAETVTDIGSLLIDGFLMRDASSYEDIIEILRDEGVLDAALAEPLMGIVKLRRPLVQDYMKLDGKKLHPYLAELPVLLERFAGAVRAFLGSQF